MPLLFSRLCDLFADLEALHKRQVSSPAAAVQHESNNRVRQWCKSLSLSIDSTDIDLVAILSALFPKRRTDRVYGIQPPSLSRKLKRILGLGNGRHQVLDRWQEAGRGDLGDCVERVQQQAEFPLQPRSRQVTIEEIDNVLASIAAGYRYSAPKVRAVATGTFRPNDDELLMSLFRRTQSREAKWLTRMILKDYGPVTISERLVFECIHNHLPIALKIHDTFEDAIGLLKDEGLRGSVDGLMPSVGVKVGRSSFAKARSVKHAVSMIQNRRMSVERKYDGEYCQVHVNRTEADYQIQIYSKSGKDSTADRVGLQDVIQKCLNLGKEACVFQKGCILEGEMVVWSDREDEILEFHKIRKHVSRSGSFLGTNLDSLPHEYEHLMVNFFDVLLVDDVSCLQLPHTARRRLLKRIICQIPGRAELASQHYLDFSTNEAPERLREHYAQAIANRWEGLVLKPADEPYFGPGKKSSGSPLGCWLKLKKDYITGLGDAADFAVIGAGYCARAASRCAITNLRWTHFHIGCLKNKDAVIQLGAKPEFVVLDSIHQSLNVKDLQHLNQHGQFRSLDVGSADCNKALALQYASWEGPHMAVAFRKPFVFEVMGGGFVKLANSEHYVLRWPRVLKIHQDRTWKECVSLNELQHLAIQASTVPDEGSLEQEVVSWRKRLEDADRGSRSVMLPWDDSQEEQFVIDQPMPSVRPRRQRSEGPTPSLVRMDTNEMAPNECRLASGEVTCRPTSSDSQSSVPTPPTSSPAAQHDTAPRKAKSKSQRLSSPINLKRPLEDPEDAARLMKKPKVAQRNSPIRPLGVSANSANRAGRATPSPASARIVSSAASFLVRKVPPGVDGLPIKSRIKRPKCVIEPESPDRQTTVSERTSQATSRLSQGSARAPSLEIEPALNRTAAPEPAVAPASTGAAMVGGSMSARVPNLLSCPVMLSPCISRTPYFLENLLPGRVTDIVPLPQNSVQTILPSPPPTNQAQDQEAVLLIESKRHEQSSQLILSALPYLQQCPYRRIEVWDWTLLELISKGETDMQRLGKRFFGSMWWDSDAREAIVYWRDGLLMRLRITPDRGPCLIEKTWRKAPLKVHEVKACAEFNATD